MTLWRSSRSSPASIPPLRHHPTRRPHRLLLLLLVLRRRSRPPPVVLRTIAIIPRASSPLLRRTTPRPRRRIAWLTMRRPPTSVALRCPRRLCHRVSDSTTRCHLLRRRLRSCQTCRSSRLATGTSSARRRPSIGIRTRRCSPRKCLTWGGHSRPPSWRP